MSEVALLGVFALFLFDRAIILVRVLVACLHSLSVRVNRSRVVHRLMMVSVIQCEWLH